MNKLNQEYYKELAKQINEKLGSATALLAEVNLLKKQAGVDMLILNNYAAETTNRKQKEFLELVDLSRIEDELDEIGWRTSSAYC